LLGKTLQPREVGLGGRDDETTLALEFEVRRPDVVANLQPPAPGELGQAQLGARSLVRHQNVALATTGGARADTRAIDDGHAQPCASGEVRAACAHDSPADHDDVAGRLTHPTP